MKFAPYPFRPEEFTREHGQKTNRKIAAAVRAVIRTEERAKSKDPLFDDGVRMTKEEAAEAADKRLEYYIQRGVEAVKRDRRQRAKDWLKVRRARRMVPQHLREAFDRIWNAETYPMTPEYASVVIRSLVLEYYGLLTQIEFRASGSNQHIKWTRTGNGDLTAVPDPKQWPKVTEETE